MAKIRKKKMEKKIVMSEKRTILWLDRAEAKLYITSILNIDPVLWHTQVIVCAVKC